MSGMSMDSLCWVCIWVRAALYSPALTQMQTQHKLSIDIPLMGAFAFDESDLRDLRECIARKESI